MVLRRFLFYFRLGVLRVVFFFLFFCAFLGFIHIAGLISFILRVGWVCDVR